MKKNEAFYLAEAIRYLLPDTGFSFNKADYSTVQWDKTPASIPTQSEVDAAIEQVKANEIAAEAQAQADKVALLARLGITADEAKLLLG